MYREILLYFYSNVIETKICARFEAYQGVKFEVPEFTNFKQVYLRMYLEFRRPTRPLSDTFFDGFSEYLGFHSFRKS